MVRIALFFLFFSLVGLPAVYASSGVGDVVYVRGEAFVERGHERYALDQGRTVLRNDVIVTGNRGRVKLLMADGSKVYVGAKSRLGLRRYAMSDGNLLKASFHMAWGRARFFVKKLFSRHSSFRVRTATAVLGVRGTSILAVVNPVTAATNFTLMTGFAEVAPIDEMGRMLPSSVVNMGQTALITEKRKMTIVEASQADMTQVDQNSWSDEAPAPQKQNNQQENKKESVQPQQKEAKVVEKKLQPVEPQAQVKQAAPKVKNRVAKGIKPAASAVQTLEPTVMAQSTAQQVAEQTSQQAIPDVNIPVISSQVATQSTSQPTVQQSVQQITQDAIQIVSPTTNITLQPTFVVP